MISLVRGGCELKFGAIVAALGLSIFFGSSPSTQAGDPGPEGPGHFGKKRITGSGTLGYGGHALYPGFPGFGLSYHLGYGYGGYGLGVGAEGGYPFYGGPGYPHEAPPLNRCGKILPFAYQGDPGYLCNGIFRGFQEVGPLVVDPPVVTSSVDSRVSGPGGDFACFSGAIPYPESVFARGTVDAASAGANSVLTPAPRSPGQARSLGIDDEPIVEPDGVRGLKVANVYPGTSAEKAGLRVGDVIHSINGYLTTERGNLAWIMANAAPTNVLTMSVRSVADGRERTISARYR